MSLRHYGEPTYDRQYSSLPSPPNQAGKHFYLYHMALDAKISKYHMAVDAKIENDSFFFCLVEQLN